MVVVPSMVDGVAVARATRGCSRPAPREFDEAQVT